VRSVRAGLPPLGLTRPSLLRRGSASNPAQQCRSRTPLTRDAGWGVGSSGSIGGVTERSHRVHPSAGVRLRGATPADASRLESIADRAFAGYVERIGLRPVPMDADYAQHIHDHEVWVAEADGAVVAFLVLVPRVGSLEVDTVAVDPEWQGRGIGRCLLDLAEERATDSGHERITLYTNQAMAENLALYRARGLVEAERGERDGRHWVWLTKSL
jgi:ribosomal protein S18 acetylase RimI-like enzyme